MDLKKLTTATVKKQIHILATRFVICFLFFCCFSSVLSQIYVSEGTTIYNHDSSIKISTSLNTSDKKSAGVIYVKADAIAKNADEEGDFKKVKIESPEIRSVKKARLKASKKADLAKKTPKMGLEQIKEKEFVNQYVFSDKVPSEIASSTGSKANFAIVNFSNFKANELATIVVFLDFQRMLINSESGNFLYSDFLFTNHYFTSFSVRPPPFFV